MDHRGGGRCSRVKWLGAARVREHHPTLAAQNAHRDLVADAANPTRCIPGVIRLWSRVRRVWQFDDSILLTTAGYCTFSAQTILKVARKLTH